MPDYIWLSAVGYTKKEEEPYLVECSGLHKEGRRTEEPKNLN
jgi:hypothetical protein